MFFVTREQLIALLECQRTHDAAWREFPMLYEDKPDLQMHTLDIVADIVGVPADNTVETQACEIANATGEWPEDAYCRDWVFHDWESVEDGKQTAEWFLRQLEEEATRHAAG
jgi:hypothetical protein